MTALERAESALRVEVERQVQANGSYSGPANGSPNYVDAELDYGLLARAVLMAVREQWLEIYHASEGKPLPTYEQAEGFPDMIDAILNEKDTTND